MRRFIPIILILAITGCRETEPPPAHFQDLGTDGSPLLPTTPVWKTAAIAHGQAEWYPFRAPSTEPEVEHDSASLNGDGSPIGGNPEIEAQIRDVITEFNEVAGTGTPDDILEYYVEEQVETLKAIVETILATRAVLQDLKREFDNKLPAAAVRSENATKAILAELSLELKGETLSVKNDSEVGVVVEGGAISKTYRFIIVDEEWYLEAQGLDGPTELGAALDLGLQYYREMLESARSGADQAEERLKELESAVAAAQSTGTDDGENLVDDGEGD